MEKSQQRSISKADEGLNRAYKLYDGFLAVIRALQTVRALTGKAESRSYGEFERKPEHIKPILGRALNEIEGRGKGEDQ